MNNKKKYLLLLSIFLIYLSQSIFHSNYTSDINEFNYNDESYLEKDNNELYNIQLSTDGPADKYNFKYYKVITIDHTKVFGSSDYSNFSLLISIFDSDLHDDVQSDGDDLAFANDTEWLDHEIELFNQEYNNTYAQLIAWVRIPHLSVSINTNITMYYGNPYLNTQENPTGVWDKNYQGVWHMKEINPIDSTSKNNNGIEYNGVTHINDGKINGANNFEGDYEYISIGNIGPEIKTIEFWMNPRDFGSAGPTETDWKSPSATGEDYDQWTDPMNAFISNNSYATENIPGEAQDWYNFNLDVPNGATINGINVTIEGYASSIAGVDVSLSWNGGDDYTAVKSNSWGSTEANKTFGGSADDWGRTTPWLSDDFKNSNFRVKLARSAQNPGVILNIDHISIKVYFTYVFMEIIDLNGTAKTEIVEGKLVATNFPGTTTIYIDGVINSSLTTNWHYIAITNSEGINISAMEIGKTSTGYFDGFIDELRVSDILREPESFNTSYYNQNDTKTFYNISQEVEFNIDPPIYSNLTESSDIIELGDIEIISINVTDLSGIRQVKIEFEGSNHSMINIWGDIWQYNLWIPSHMSNYTYTIYMEDNCGILNSVSNSIKVVDTTPPNPPVIVNAPGNGTYSTLVFDWEDGFDLSGIAFYNVIIDNESNPYTTPGFIYNINITNAGSTSSYYELTDSLTPGTYYYFLLQIDGAGLKSNYTTGSFNIIPYSTDGNGITFLDLLPYIIGSVIASITVIIVLRKRILNKIHPPRKKIPLKVVIAHISKISSTKPTFKKEDHKKILDNQLTDKEGTIDEKVLEKQLNEIKILGEELFNEGAYIEAQKQFELAEKLFLKLDKKEETNFYSKLVADIIRLSEEREDKLENLEKEIEKKNFIKVLDLYFDLIKISKKLKDFDIMKMYQSEVIQLLKDEKLKISNLENKRNSLEERANKFLDQNLFEEAAKFYENCEEISHLLLQLDRVEENYNIDKFRAKRNESLKKIIKKNSGNKS